MNQTTPAVDFKQLVADLKKIGLKNGDDVYVHSSLKSIGWIEGGPASLIDAFLEVLGTEGTLLVPTHTYCFTKRGVPPYNKHATPTVLGAFPEAVRLHSRALRSDNGSHSSAAIGKNAEYYTASHDKAFAMGYDSPLNRLYCNHGKILLLGVTHKANTSIHLVAEQAV